MKKALFDWVITKLFLRKKIEYSEFLYKRLKVTVWTLGTLGILFLLIVQTHPILRGN